MDGKLFLGGRDDLRGHLFPGEPDIGTSTETSFGGCPNDSENGHVGVGSFHTHPAPGTNGPSPADINTYGSNAQHRKYPSIFHYDDTPYGKSELDCIADSKGEMICITGVDRGKAAGYDIIFALGGDKEMAECLKELKRKHPGENISPYDTEGADIGIVAEAESKCADPFFRRYADSNDITFSTVTL
ncbi:Uncharacterised protein [uncultured archaeon]|nr:Uncharacterised protein [uncultured archaeon]